jgi:predicted nucleic acid-binding protein
MPKNTKSEWQSVRREYYRARADKAWSLTDCISFVVMSEHGLSEALTADVHFEQASFRALLRDPV